MSQADTWRAGPDIHAGRYRRCAGGLGFLLAAALAGLNPAAGQDAGGPALDSLTQARIDALGADAGTPAYQDGFAGLLVMHARRDPARARAMARYAITRTPATRESVGRALDMTGLAGTATAPEASAGTPATVGAASSLGGAEGLRDGAGADLPSWPIGYRPFGFGEAAADGPGPVDADLGQRFDAPDGLAATAAEIQVRETLRPAPTGLASPQLR
jgi:hypothetical protein